MTWRPHPITGDPILHAPARGDRPHAFASTNDATDAAGSCPFCPGNEAETPPEIARVSVGDSWTARVFANKYPAAPGHEVIVESARHEDTFASIADPAAVLRLTIERYGAHRDAAYVALFKNHGTAAGASIPHLHSQLLPIPFTPPRVARELAGFANADVCPLCAPLEHGIAEGSSFVWVAPYGSSMAYQQWLVPRRHIADVTELRDDEIAELAMWLQKATTATLAIAPAYNWTFQNFAGATVAHFYVELFPRMTAIAGFELGTGAFIEVVDPAVAAERLRPEKDQRQRRNSGHTLASGTFNPCA